jgi:lipoyl(octanoyl) transferase
MQKVVYEDLGKIGYKEAWDYQESVFQRIVEAKLRNRALPDEEKEQILHHLIFCEHPHVYTLGKSGSEDHLLLSGEELGERKAEFYRINRGGDITYHGPGQLVGYPIFDLDGFFTDIHKYLRYLEEAVIRTLAEYGIRGGRIEGFTGVWLEEEDPVRARKICAMGVKCSRWVTMHGFAFNVNVDLEYFKNIIPCGIADKPVTSLAKELGHAVDSREVKQKLLRHLCGLFGIELILHEKKL